MCGFKGTGWRPSHFTYFYENISKVPQWVKWRGESFEQKIMKEKVLPLILSSFLGVDLLLNLQIVDAESEGHICIE